MYQVQERSRSFVVAQAGSQAADFSRNLHHVALVRIRPCGTAIALRSVQDACLLEEWVYSKSEHTDTFENGGK